MFDYPFGKALRRNRNTKREVLELADQDDSLACAQVGDLDQAFQLLGRRDRPESREERDGRLAFDASTGPDGQGDLLDSHVPQPFEGSEHAVLDRRFGLGVGIEPAEQDRRGLVGARLGVPADRQGGLADDPAVGVVKERSELREQPRARGLRLPGQGLGGEPSDLGDGVAEEADHRGLCRIIPELPGSLNPEQPGVERGRDVGREGQTRADGGRASVDEFAEGSLRLGEVGRGD